MSRRAAFLLLSLLSPLGGCRALVREGEAIAYRPGTVPATATAKCDATYTLDAVNPNTNTKYGRDTVDIPKGATVGFRREPDGSLVALAGEKVVTIPDEPAAWRYTPAPVTRWDRFSVAARDACESAATAVILMPFILWQVVTGGEVP
ncbi:MAG: hypothetical protein J0I06_04070 [Planctomycetes bacterium]|nr:hypothetical protein [Planctomycetota bacterium]